MLHGLMLGQSRRQWASVSPALDKRLVIAGKTSSTVPTTMPSWPGDWIKWAIHRPDN